MKKFKISVIIPIYNVGNYLEETIMSVVKQSIGFKNIQLILVNDGSTDNSEDVCLKFKNMYPNMISSDLYKQMFGATKDIDKLSHSSFKITNIRKSYSVISDILFDDNNNYSSGGGGFSSGGGGGSFGGGGGGGGFR